MSPALLGHMLPLLCVPPIVFGVNGFEFIAIQSNIYCTNKHTHAQDMKVEYDYSPQTHSHSVTL